MKITFILCLLAEMCVGQQYNLNVPKIDNSFEKFDMSIFPITPGKQIRYEKIETSGKTRYVLIDMNYYQENDSLHFILKNYTKSNQTGLLFGYDYSINPIIGIFKEFYPDGHIKQKGLYCILGFKFGYWYSFDKNGALIGSENFDDCYPFDYKKVFDFCIKNGVPLIPRNASGAIETEITKYGNDWYISYNNKTRKLYQLNGETGELLKFSEMPLPHGDE